MTSHIFVSPGTYSSHAPGNHAPEDVKVGNIHTAVHLMRGCTARALRSRVCVRSRCNDFHKSHREAYEGLDGIHRLRACTVRTSVAFCEKNVWVSPCLENESQSTVCLKIHLTRHLEVGHEREEGHEQDGDHDDQSNGHVHSPVGTPYDIAACAAHRLVQISRACTSGQEAGLHHKEVQQEPHRTWHLHIYPHIPALGTRDGTVSRQ